MSKELIVRIIVSLVAFVNAACAAFGIAPLEVDEETVYTVVSFVFMFGTWVWGFWKNNDMTNAAQAGSAVTHAIKAGAVSVDEAFSLAAGVEEIEERDLDGAEG